jgi:hypothetical protein
MTSSQRSILEHEIPLPSSTQRPDSEIIEMSREVEAAHRFPKIVFWNDSLFELNDQEPVVLQNPMDLLHTSGDRCVFQDVVKGDDIDGAICNGWQIPL